MKYCVRAIAIAAVFVCGIDTSPSFGQGSEAKPPGIEVDASIQFTSADLVAIRDGAESFVTSFNKGDAKAVAAHWTEDGDYVNAAGQTFMGRAAIEEVYADLFANNPYFKIRIVIDSLRLLSGGVAIEDGRAVVQPPPPGAPGVSEYTVVHVKVDGKWLMASVRDTWIETQITRQSIADFGWLIGTWVAEEHGNQSESIYRWVADESFVIRTYTTTHVDGTKTSGVQLIGWNPLQGRVQSWSFSPDSGHAVGVWSPNQGGWTAEMIGVTGDGKPTTSLIRLTRLDENACVWQSIQRTLGGVALLDTDEVVIKRQTPEPPSQPTER